MDDTTDIEHAVWIRPCENGLLRESSTFLTMYCTDALAAVHAIVVSGRQTMLGGLTPGRSEVHRSGQTYPQGTASTAAILRPTSSLECLVGPYSSNTRLHAPASRCVEGIATVVRDGRIRALKYCGGARIDVVHQAQARISNRA